VSDRERIEVAEQCHDCDVIPKTTNAGEVVTAGSETYQVMHNGLKVYADSHYGSYNVEVIRRLRGHHEPQEERAFYEALKRIPSGSSILEVGSFWAYYSLWFLNSVPDSKAFMVEPLNSALDAGRRNFQLNKRQGTFLRASIDSFSASESSVELWPGMSVDVERTTIDALMQRFGLSERTVLHADIQGAEVRMLHGASRALSEKKISWIFISTHGENIHRKCLQMLKGHGYAILAEHTPAESYSVDGLIAATSDRSAPRIFISRRQSWYSRKARLKAQLRVCILERLNLKPHTV
jgi:FkbM family methyltransferase